MKVELKADSRMIFAERFQVEEFKVNFSLPKVCGLPLVSVNYG